MNVTIIRDKEAKYPSGSLIEGAKAILIDGKKWGTIEMDRLGSHGTCYFFHQEGRPGRIEVAGSQFRVYSDKHARFERSGEAWMPLSDRLVNATRELLRRRALRNPILVAKENERAAISERKRRERRKAKEELRWRAIAEKALAKARQQKSVEPILEAMKWAYRR